MLRVLIRLLFLAGAVFLAAPFVLSSLAIDTRGVTIRGTVRGKSETVTVHYAGWKRNSEATLQYDAPDAPGASYHKVALTPAEYDALHVGEAVSLRYLLRKDVPAVPMADALRQMHALPMVHLAHEESFAGLQQLGTPNLMSVLEALAALVILLLVLRRAGSVLFWWVAGGAVVAGIALLTIHDFPKPTPQPRRNVLQTSARVKSLDRIENLFQDNHNGGFTASQPVDVVGLEFVPAGRTEPVVAVDLVDSWTGLQENAEVAIVYEADTPRTAYIQRATRTFVARNINGIALDLAACLAVLIALYLLWRWLGRGYDRLVNRSGSANQRTSGM